MPSFDILRSIFLHLLIGMVSGMAWAWSLTMSSRLEQRLGARVPFAGGVGALLTLIVLLLGGWKMLLPLQHWLTSILQPMESLLFGVLAILGWMLWIGFTIGIGVGALRKPVPTKSTSTVFGFRRRRF